MCVWKQFCKDGKKTPLKGPELQNQLISLSVKTPPNPQPLHWSCQMTAEVCSALESSEYRFLSRCEAGFVENKQTKPSLHGWSLKRRSNTQSVHESQIPPSTSIHRLAGYPQPFSYTIHLLVVTTAGHPVSTYVRLIWLVCKRLSLVVWPQFSPLLHEAETLHPRLQIHSTGATRSDRFGRIGWLSPEVWLVFQLFVSLS